MLARDSAPVSVQKFSSDVELVNDVQFHLSGSQVGDTHADHPSVIRREEFRSPVVVQMTTSDVSYQAMAQPLPLRQIRGTTLSVGYECAPHPTETIRAGAMKGGIKRAMGKKMILLEDQFYLSKSYEKLIIPDLDSRR